MKVSDEILEEIIEEIDKGISIEDASDNRGINPNHVRRYLFTRKGEKGKKILMEELEGEIPIYDILRIYQDDNNQKKLSEIADEFGIPFKKISEGLKMYELLTGEKVNRNNKFKQRDDIDKKKMIEQYKKGVTIKELMLIYNCSESTIRRTIEENDEDQPLKKQHEINYFKRENKSEILLPIEEIVSERSQGKDLGQIADNYDVSKAKIQKILKKQEEQLLLMIGEVEKGKSIEDVAAENNINSSKLIKRLMDFGITRGLNILIKDMERQLPIEEISNRYENGEDDVLLGLSAKYNINSKELLAKIKEYKELIKTKRSRKVTYFDTTLKKEGYVIDLYKKGDSLELIYNKCEFGRSKIKKILNMYAEEYGKDKEEQLEKKHRNNMHKKHPSRKKILLPVENIVRLYKQNLPVVKIAQFYGVSPTTISSRLQEYYKTIDIEEKNIER